MGSTRFLLLVGLAAAAVPPGTVLWNASVGCHHWGPGCWIPNFSGTDSTPALSRLPAKRHRSMRPPALSVQRT